MEKKVLDGYMGIKFNARCTEEKLPHPCEEFISSFKENGKRLLHYHMAPANGGNMSAVFQTGFLITASACNLGCIEDDEIVYVEEFSIENKRVKYRGSRPPSSETFLHGLLYREKKNIQAVIHAHDEIATSMNLSGLIRETEREEPYGTVELAGLCLETFRKGSDIIVLKNHGYVAVGSSLTRAADIIINMHHHLLQLNIE
jgi:L-fuculose-phosphate aldolase